MGRLFAECFPEIEEAAATQGLLLTDADIALRTTMSRDEVFEIAFGDPNGGPKAIRDQVAVCDPSTDGSFGHL